MGGKSKKQTVGYKYYLGMHQIFCHGPIDAVTRFTVDDRAAWTGNNTGSQINVNAPNLFGGDAREGGVSGLIDIEMGRNTQGKNSYLLSKLGSLIPAYRGVVGAVFRQCYLGNNPYLKATRWRGQRIHVRQDGVEQWYDAKALIASQNPTASAKLIVADVALDANGSSTDGSDGGYLFGLTDGDTLIVTAGSAPWSYTPSDSYPGFPNPYTYKFGIRNTDNGTVYGPYWSEQYLTSAAGTAARAGETLELSLPAGNYKFFLWDATVNDNRFIGHYALSYIPGVADMNPIHIIRECLTDPVWGMGYPDSDIDDTVFQAAADTIYQEGLGMSLLWDKQIKLEEFIDEIKKHIDAAVYVSRKTGKYVIKLIRNDYDPVTLLHLDESNISRIEDPSRTSFGELINSVTVNYWDTVTGKDASLTVTDTALVQVQGAVISTTVQYPGFTTARNATIAGQRDLRTLSSPALSCTVYADSTAKDLNIGDVFKMSWSRWGLSEVIMRVANIAYGTGRNNQVRIECTQDSFDTNTTIVIAPPTTSWDDPSAPPTAPAYEIAGEAPYYEIVQLSGQADTDNKLLTHPEIGYVFAAASRAGSAINARIHSDAGAGYEDVGALDFSPAATLVADITKTQTSITIENQEDMAEVVLGTHFQIGDELLRIDAVTDDVLTVGRGVLDTVPQEHSAGDFLLFWDQYAGFDPAEYIGGEEVDVKITPVSGAGVLPIDEAIALPVVLNQRAARPYAPGDLRINDDSYLPDVVYEGDLTITWKHRNRLEQTGGYLDDHTGDNIGPEPGTVYRVQGYVDGVLTYTEDDIDGNSATWTPADEGLLTVEVHAKRDGLYSWQAPAHSFYYAPNSIIYTIEGNERRTEEGSLRITED